jgi:hypothetical protein
MSKGEQTNFLYVLVKEKDGEKIDTTLRIVYWDGYWEDCDGDDAVYQPDPHFVIYGARPNSKISGEYIPYRLSCRAKEQVHHFVKSVISPDHIAEIELHQFNGYNDTTDDWYDIQWENTANNSSTEIVAFDVHPKKSFDGEDFLDIHSALHSVLDSLMNLEFI